MSVFQQHLERLKAGAFQAKSLEQVPEWLEQNTFLNGKPFSFSGHRYQLGIIRSKAQNLAVIKPSQIGASEMVARMILARAAILKPYNVIYAMPSAKAAQDFFKTRVSPVVEESPYLSALVDRSNDSVGMKRIGYSTITAKGARLDSQAISVPADCVCADEYAFCDQTVVKQFNSRLTHSPHKHMIYFSTPLMPNMSIHTEFMGSRRHFRMCKCVHCNEWFWPNFLEHCRIHEHDVDWMLVTKQQLMDLPWQDTQIYCPNCGKVPDLSHEFREWVCENDDSRSNSDGFRCSPFDVPSLIKPAYLAEKSVAYNRKVDWLNNNLGLEAEDKESSLLRVEVEECLIAERPDRGLRVIGMDIGMTSHLVVMEVRHDVRVVIHLEAIPIQNLQTRYFEVKREFNAIASILDGMPYTETVLAIQSKDPNCWANFYSTTKSTELFRVKMQDEDRDKAKVELRRVTIFRDLAFDQLMLEVRMKTLLKLRSDNDSVWVDHMLSMKRMQEMMDDGNIRMTWIKSDGNDHSAHATVFAMVASRLVGASRGVGVALPLVSTFKVKP